MTRGTVVFSFVTIVLLAQTAPPEPKCKLEGDLAAKARAAVVRVVNRTKGIEANGVIIGRKDALVHVLTAAHLVNYGDLLEAKVYPGGGGKALVIKRVDLLSRTDPATSDLALLTMEIDPDVTVTSMPLASDKSLPTRDKFIACSIVTRPGAEPEPRGEQITGNAVVRKPKAAVGAQFWRCAALPQPGRSGSPLVLSSGELIGICSGGDENASFYSHIQEIRKLLKRAELDHLVK